LVGIILCCNAYQIDDTSRLAKIILASKVFPNITNETDARIFATLLQKDFNNYLKSQEGPAQTVAPFPCPLTGRSNPRPTNAKRLLPGDVDVAASIGDSLVAAMGALSTTIFTIFTEYRGHSFGGGDEKTFNNFVTVPAILKLYNPNLKGAAVGNGDANSANAVLNVAVSGARSYQLATQLTNLENKMKNLGVTANDWKLITLFIGGNDLCDYCTDTAKHSPSIFQANVGRILDTIKATFPRVFVNLVSPPDVTLLGKVNAGFCSVLHSFECDCASDAGTTEAHKQYTQKLVELVAQPKYQDKEDFHVSLQPFLSELVLPVGSDGKPDRSYFAPDCFHFSGKSHQAASVALWNNMCESGKKLTSWVPGEPLECPDNNYLS